jgi:hypothetical protein
MKKYIQFITLSVMLVFCACEQETLPTYNGQNEVYFRYASETTASYVVDSSLIRFGYDTKIKDDSIIRIKVRVMGEVVDYDRPVNFILVDTSSTAKPGGDIDLLLDRSFVPAGKIDGEIVVKIKNTANLNNKYLKAGLRLVENEYFKVDYKKTLHSAINNAGNIVATEYRVVFDNASEMPNLWAFYETSRFAMFFGAYTDKKFRLLCEIGGFDRDYFTYIPPQTASAVFTERFPTAIVTMVCRLMNRYLIEYEATHGEPLREDNGQIMEMGLSGKAYL